MKQANLTGLEKIVTLGVNNLVKTIEFSEWFAAQSANDGDIVVMNNSFIYRDKSIIKTTKNEQYLCLRVKDGKPQKKVFVAKGGDINSDFKLLSGKAANLSKVERLDTAARRELERLGQLVFVLIGEIKDEPCGVPLNHSYATELRFDPTGAGPAIVDKAKEATRIVLRQLSDPEAAWNEIEPTIKHDLGDGSKSVADAFASAYEKLRDEAVSKLHLPRPRASKSEASFAARLRQSVADQRKLYDDALVKCTAVGSDRLHLNEVLRIAYNFADDALKVLQLLVSVSDLKGVLLWCTVYEHFDLARAFRNLPWTKSSKKPSLSRYQEIINGARNKAFHNLLSFDRTIQSDLYGVSINARSLTLLPAHGRRKGHVAFDYEDRELVEVLTELTLAPETAVSMGFWKRNSVVMHAFEHLLRKMEEALCQLNTVRE